MKQAFVLAGLSLGLLAATASASESSREERVKNQVVYLVTGDEPPTMDPNKNIDSVSGFWLGHIFEGLMTTDKAGKIVPGTAEKMTVSADGKTYTFQIRKDAKWHDGKPVTAQDFEYSFRRLVNPDYASEYSFIAETAQIKNASEILARKAPLDSLGAKALNDHTFEVTLNTPVLFFPSLLTLQTFFPIRKDLAEKYGDKFTVDAASLIGNGPFALKKWQKEAAIRIEKAPNYWNAKQITITAIEAPVMVKDGASQYNLFKTGGTDIVSLDAERLKIAAQDKQQIKSFSDGRVDYLRLNQREGRTLENIKLRKAIQLVVNRKEYVNKISGIPGDKPTFGFVADMMPGAKAGQTYRQVVPMKWKDGDEAKARELVKEYLKDTGKTEVPALALLANDNSTGIRGAEYFQHAIQSGLGITVKIDSVPFKTRLQKQREGQYDISLTSWGPDYFDAQTYLDVFTTQKTNPNIGFSNPEFDKAVEMAQKSTDAAKRLQYMKEAEEILVIREVVIVPFLQRGKAYLIAPELKGVGRRPIFTDPDFRFAKWQNTNFAKQDSKG